mgnify:CR=1 FL=1
MMFRIIFTLDYEIHGNGDGSPFDLMVEPTDRMISLFDRFGAKLTILADVAEIMRFRDYRDEHSKDDYHYGQISEQLIRAAANGHDVQLHVHSSYLEAEHEDGKWKQNWEEYNLAALEPERLNEIIRSGKRFLEDLIKPYVPGYSCHVFRAANWSMQPSRNIIRALTDNGIRIDTSVYKYGSQSGIVNFDYSGAPGNLIPWFADEDEITKHDPDGKLLEVPIYCEPRKIFAFVTPMRLFRFLRAKRHLHRVPEHLLQDQPEKQKTGKKGVLSRKRPWKMDLNQATGKQLIAALKRIDRKYGSFPVDLPVVLIGHSKTFIKYNEHTLKPFLKFVSRNSERFRFATFGDINVESFRNIPLTESTWND